MNDVSLTSCSGMASWSSPVVCSCCRDGDADLCGVSDSTGGGVSVGLSDADEDDAVRVSIGVAAAADCSGQDSFVCGKPKGNAAGPRPAAPDIMGKVA